MCPGGTVSKPSHLAPYLKSRCEVLSSSLFLNAIGSTITEEDLSEAFGNVTIIEGGLYVTGNIELPSLDFLSKLEDVNVVYIVGNPGLVDARLPSLWPFTSLDLNNNRRLCSDNGPFGLGGCATIDVETTLAVSGGLAGYFDAAERLRFSDVVDSLLGFTAQVYIKSFSMDDSDQLLITLAGVVEISESYNLLSV